MANKVYVGVSSKARQVKSMYIGVSNVARKVTKAYIGVNNVARLCYLDTSWYLPSGISASNVLAAYRFKGAASETEALKDLSGNGYTLTKSASTITWSSSGIYFPNAQNVGLVNATLYNNSASVSACCFSYAGVSGMSDNKHVVGGVCLADKSSTNHRMLHLLFNGDGYRYRYTKKTGTGSNYSTQDSSYVSSISAGALGANFDNGSAVYVNGASVSSRTTGGLWFVQNVTGEVIGNYFRTSAYSFMAWTLRALVFYKTTLTAAQFSTLYSNMNAL